MDVSSPQAVAAVVAGVVAICTAVVTSIVTVWIAGKRAAVDEKLARLKGGFDKELAEARAKFERELAEQKAQLDNKTIFAAERVARELMMDDAWRWRTFKVIKHHLGGFEDDELRKILVQAGAIRMMSADGQELWGLLDRNRRAVGLERINERPAGWSGADPKH